MIKRCRRCGEEKALSEFYRQEKMADGHLNKCKSCCIEAERQRRIRNIDRIRAYDRRRGSDPKRVQARAEYAKTEAGRAAHARAARKWMGSHPDRRSASIAVNNAVRDGRITPMACFVCGADAQAHHPDYSRPLDVVWLCPKHHKEAHALTEQINKENP